MAEKTTSKSLHVSGGEPYASKVFKESSVGMVSSLAHTSSLGRKAFKVLALILCLIGFMYQSGSFLRHVFEYPTTVDLDIIRPEMLQVPGYTFCDNNGINRRIFCQKFPERCEEPTADFCRRYEYYCGENKTLVPKKEFYIVNNNLTLEDMVELNVSPEKFVNLAQMEVNEFITGPLMRKEDLFEPAYICYSLYDRVNNSKDVVTVKKKNFFREPVNTFTFNVRADEMFTPGKRAGILFWLHSPYLAVNPFEMGIFMKPGRTYLIFVSMLEEVLLEKPYRTDCLNYTEIWEKNGRIGPRSQEMCQHECFVEISMKCYNCVYPDILYPTNKKICLPDDIKAGHSCTDEYADKESRKCAEKCRDDCRRTKYEYTVQERYNPNLVENMESENDIYTKIAVEIYLEGDEVFVVKHSPKYMIVEVFSSIGGFIGCWLGISLLDFADIFEGFFRIIRHSFKKVIPRNEEKIAL